MRGARGTTRRAWTSLLAVALAALALAASGCERREKPQPSGDTPSVRVLATEGFGAETLLDARAEPLQSAFDATRGATPLKTAYGGGFIAEMLGRSSDAAARRDWFLFVGGVESDVGAKDIRLRVDDTAWWDFRSWAGQMRVSGAVGLWPEPFVHGIGGPPTAVAADPPLSGVLARDGVPVGADDAPWRVRVGSDEDLRRRDPTWRDAAADPTAAGLAGAVEAGRITLLGADGEGRVPVPGARAVAVLLPTGSKPSKGALLAVVGVDAASAEAAAERIAREPAVLSLRFAVAFDGTGTPLRAAGRGGP